MSFVSQKTDVKNERNILLVVWFGLIANKAMFFMSKVLLKYKWGPGGIGDFFSPLQV